MNSGGEPERDEYGLPPVDIQVPDDARELDRDVQAYYRELRAERRRQRRRRLHLSLARDGIVLPLLACCLILALITGTLLTVFTATSGQDLIPQPGTSKPVARHPAAHRSPSGQFSPTHRQSRSTGSSSTGTSSSSTGTSSSSTPTGSSSTGTSSSSTPTGSSSTGTSRSSTGTSRSSTGTSSSSTARTG